MFRFGVGVYIGWRCRNLLAWTERLSTDPEFNEAEKHRLARQMDRALTRLKKDMRKKAVEMEIDVEVMKFREEMNKHETSSNRPRN